MRQLCRERLASAACGSLGIIAACSSGGVVPARTPVAPVVRASAARPTVRASMVHHRAGSWRYRVQTDAIVTLTGDTTAPAAPLRRVAIYHVSLDTAAGGFRITGQVDSTLLTVGGKVPARPTDTLKPAFSAHLDSTGLTDLSGTAGAPGPCRGGLDPAVASVQGLFIALPSRLTPGASWQDSTSTVTCRGSIPVTSTVHRTYTVVDSASWNGHATIRLNVATTSTLTGSGLASDAGDSISVHGTGTSSGSLMMDPETAMPLSTTVTGQSAVSVINRRTTLAFDQRVTETITLLDYPPAAP